jgi:acyl carrier protein
MVADMKDQIRDFVQELANAKGVSSFTDEESLLENGVLDSMTIFRVVSFLEDSFRIRIGDEDIYSENFETVEKIEKYVQSKWKGSEKAG